MEWRKSWASENIYGKDGKGSCTKRLLLPDERSVWDDYLDMAALNIIPGQISISLNMGYTIEQLAELLKTPVETINRANVKLQATKSIIVENNGIVTVLNWKNYQTEWERIKDYYNGRSTIKPTLEHTTEPTLQKKNKNIDIDIKTAKVIYTYWNSLNIFTHKVPDKHYKAIAAALTKGYTEDEIKVSMKNYAYILKNPAYRWTYRWECWEFVRRGVEKFMDLGRAKANFMMEGNVEDEQIAKVRQYAKEGK